MKSKFKIKVHSDNRQTNNELYSKQSDLDNRCSQTDRQTDEDKQKDRQPDRWNDNQIPDRQTDRQIDRELSGQRDKPRQTNGRPIYFSLHILF